MKCNYFIAPLFLFPLCVSSQSESLPTSMQFTQEAASKNAIVRTYSSEAKKPDQINSLNRTIDYPTQIIRITGSLENQQLTCEQVNDAVDKLLIDNITEDKFTYTTYINCNYDPETNLATQFRINSYFDPLTDEAVQYSNEYLAENNGSDFLGTRFNVESAKGLIISLNFAAGVKKNPKNPPFIQYRQDHNNFYFKSNYDMRNKLFTDVYHDFFSDDPNRILPFINKWIFPHGSTFYRAILKDSNYVELQPERIFLMENGDEIFVSGLRYYFAHNCTLHENHHCLKNS